MDNGKEVIAKIPNPNAGLSHFTTASEVAIFVDAEYLTNAGSTGLCLEFQSR
jgi:hypothetical protein